MKYQVSLLHTGKKYTFCLMLQYIFNHPFHSKSETFGLVFRLCLYSTENSMVPWRNEISQYFNHLLRWLVKSLISWNLLSPCCHVIFSDLLYRVLLPTCTVYNIPCMCCVHTCIVLHLNKKILTQFNNTISMCMSYFSFYKPLDS